MKTNYGIENLKEAVKSVCEVAGKVDNSLEDGKIDVFEGIGIATESLRGWKNVKKFKEIKQEALDLSEEERQELTAYFKEKFDIRNEKAEEIVEAGIELILSMTELLEIINKNR